MDRSSAVIVGMVLLAPYGSAQCLEWDRGFARTGIDGVGCVLLEYDLGLGPRLLVGGSFVNAGDVRANDVADWDGGRWSPLDHGIDPSPFLVTGAMAAVEFDDGTGPALYLGGTFERASGAATGSLARWNGTQWSAVGGGIVGTVLDFVVHDDGTGPALYVAGAFSAAGGTPATNVARWNGTAWSALGVGLGGSGATRVSSLAVHDDGTGPALHASGVFTESGATPLRHLARWNGNAWGALPPNVLVGADEVRALTVHTVGGVSHLYAVGNFATAGMFTRADVSVWDGVAWTDLGSSFLGRCFALEMLQFGGATRLVAAGDFHQNGGQPIGRIAEWNGTAWDPLGSGFDDGSVTSVAAFAGALFAAGSFRSSGGDVQDGFARFDGVDWRAPFVAQGFDGAVLALAECDLGQGPVLHAAGAFTSAGSTRVPGIASWNGSAWSPLGSGLGVPGDGVRGARAIAVFDDGSGPALYAGGTFDTAGGVPVSGFARWDGAGWSAIGSGGLSSVNAFAVLGTGSNAVLCAAGPNGVETWDGASWSSLSGGLSGSVTELAALDLAGVPTLFAAGAITVSDSSGTTLGIARWDGVRWTGVSGGTPGLVEDLHVHDDGVGAVLLVAGEFDTIGGLPIAGLARWDGAQWSSLGLGPSEHVRALGTFDDGGGRALVALHSTPTATGPAVGLARHANGTWTDLHAAIDAGAGASYAILAHDDGQGGEDLYVGGDFGSVATLPSSRIARWNGCGTVVEITCAGDGTTAACPCANAGATGHGCANSRFATGAVLRSTGLPRASADDFELEVAGATGSLVLFVQGELETAPVVQGDGIGCLGGTLVLLGARTAAGGSARDPGPGDAPIRIRGGIPPIGGTRVYQALYRNAALAFCPPGTSNRSNGLRARWVP